MSEEMRQKRLANPLIPRIIAAGWLCVGLSAGFLWLSSVFADDPAKATLWALFLMLARLFGIASFAIGGLAIFNHRWAVGIALFLISVALPFLAYSLFGTF